MSRTDRARVPIVSLLMLCFTAGVYGQDVQPRTDTQLGDPPSVQSVPEHAPDTPNQGEAVTPSQDAIQQDPQAILEALRDDALLVDIQAQVESDDDRILWSMQFREITVYGKGVQIRIHGLNLTIEAEFTPFTQQNGDVVLLAKGQTWLRDEGTKEVQYQSAFTSVPIVLGDPVIFYPLGVDSQEAGLGKANLVLHIRIQSLSEFLEKSQEGQ